ncbi:MAG: hypothetical protein KDC33_07405 [Thermoleophilia bacterium]|nr:hypothetical protein [Thermoleophilia bacterium]
MSITCITETRENRRIMDLLDRLDHTAAPCAVPGCVHQHDHDWETERPPTLAVA